MELGDVRIFGRIFFMGRWVISYVVRAVSLYPTYLDQSVFNVNCIFVCIVHLIIYVSAFSLKSVSTCV